MKSYETFSNEIERLEAAQQELALLLSAIDAAGDVILVYRVDPKTQDLVLVYMNDAYTRQTGYTREEALGRRLQHLRKAMPDDPGMAHLRETIARGEPEQMEIVSYRKDGSSFWNQVTIRPIRDESGAIAHWISVERDVTEAVERESKLEDQQARLLLLTSAARRLFGALDPRTLLARLEEAVRDLVGGATTVYAVLADGRTAPTRDLRIPENADRFGDALIERAARTRGHVRDERLARAAAAVVMGGRAAFVIEVKAGTGQALRGGDLFVLDLLAEYFGVAVHNAALVTELEERRSDILELHQVKTDLIAMLAHDFKGPLTSIVGFTELAIELGEVNPDQREYLESVKRLALRLADLATDTLAFSRLERNEIDLSPSDVDMPALARDIAQAFGDQREVRITSSGPPAVRGDAHRLRQVLYNLIENAVKFSPENAPVDVRVEGTKERVRIRVTDRGIGIPESELGQIFGRFSRATNARRLGIAGTGFGLYLARQIVELHGGTLLVESIEGQGSTFTMTLPRTPEAPPEHALTVAVLDTERESRSFIAHALREAGLRVRVEHTVRDLLEWLRANAVDRIVIDVDDVLLTPDEITALEREQRHKRFAIVAVGIGGKNLFEEAATLSKPFLSHDLLSALGTIRSRPV